MFYIFNKCIVSKRIDAERRIEKELRNESERIRKADTKSLLRH
jgi:hypothetical protein